MILWARMRASEGRDFASCTPRGVAVRGRSGCGLSFLPSIGSSHKPSLECLRAACLGPGGGGVGVKIRWSSSPGHVWNGMDRSELFSVLIEGAESLLQLLVRLGVDPDRLVVKSL